MKDKIKKITTYDSSRKTIFWISILLFFLFFLSAVYAYHYNQALTFSQRFTEFANDKLTDIAIGLLTAVVFFLLTDRMIEKTRDIKEEQGRDEFLVAIDKLQARYKDQLYYMDVDSGLTLAKRFIETARDRIMVIGTAKSELLNTSSEKVIRSYMEATENAINERYIIYKRITKFDANEALIDHLKKCLKINDPKDGKKSEKAEVLIMDEFMTANTFLIVDEEFLFISPTSMSGDLEISRRCHITTNKKIIITYTNHFNDIFERESKDRYIFKSGNDLDTVLPELKNINHNANQIKNGISKFTSNGKTWQLRYSNKFLEEISNRVQLMSNESFEVKHNEVYSDLHSLAASFLDILEKNDEYETISFPLFWKDMNGNTPLFELANKKAFERGVKIKRILIIDEKKLSDKDYEDSLRNSLIINTKWENDYTVLYDLKIVLNDDETGFSNSPFSFAEIIKNYNSGCRDKWILSPDNENSPRATKVFHLYEYEDKTKNNYPNDEFTLKNYDVIEYKKKYQQKLHKQKKDEVADILQNYFPKETTKEEIKKLL